MCAGCRLAKKNIKVGSERVKLKLRVVFIKTIRALVEQQQRKEFRNHKPENWKQQTRKHTNISQTLKIDSGTVS